MNQSIARKEASVFFFFQVVYKIIEEHGTQGIWAREIRSKSNLHLNTVEKVLRKLESKKLIKSFNSVAVSFRNI